MSNNFLHKFTVSFILLLIIITIIIRNFSRKKSRGGGRRIGTYENRGEGQGGEDPEKIWFFLFPVQTVSVESSFSQMKVLKKIELLPGKSYDLFTKIAIESAQTLSEEELEQIGDIWNGKPRRRTTIL